MSKVMVPLGLLLIVVELPRMLAGGNVLMFRRLTDSVCQQRSRDTGKRHL